MTLPYLTGAYCVVAFAGWTLTLVTVGILRRTYQVLVQGKRSNELGASAVRNTTEGAAPLSGAATEVETLENSVWKRLERAHANCTENCMFYFHTAAFLPLLSHRTELCCCGLMV
jgi:hypothetical protein